jgi:hypothetical protein
LLVSGVVDGFSVDVEELFPGDGDSPPSSVASSGSAAAAGSGSGSSVVTSTGTDSGWSAAVAGVGSGSTAAALTRSRLLLAPPLRVIFGIASPSLSTTGPGHASGSTHPHAAHSSVGSSTTPTVGRGSITRRGTPAAPHTVLVHAVPTISGTTAGVLVVRSTDRQFGHAASPTAYRVEHAAHVSKAMT